MTTFAETESLIIEPRPELTMHFTDTAVHSPLVCPLTCVTFVGTLY